MEIKELTKNSATLTWKESSEDGGSPITHYLVEQREAWKTTWTYVEKKKAPATSHKFTRLTEGAEYIVRVKAENKIGQSEPLESEKFTPKNLFGKHYRLCQILCFCFTIDFLFRDIMSIFRFFQGFY
jgi:titin